MGADSGGYIALSGGVGGAKLALGLSYALPPSQLTVIGNTGDDFEHLGMYISPDLDTLLYTLAGLNNEQLGWGRRDETWNFADTCRLIGLDTWFRLGDKDLAIHVYRSKRLREGAGLTQITGELCKKFKVRTNIVPMSDTAVRTMMETDIGTLTFQEYFVKNRCNPKVSSIRFAGIDRARPAPALLQCLKDEQLQAVIICPSNPFLSIAPILSLPHLRESIIATGKPVIVVSPIVQGNAIKGPTARLMRDLNLHCNVGTIAGLYRDIASVIVIDRQDEAAADKIASMGLKVHSTDIVMNKLQDKIELARSLITLSQSL